MTTDFNNFEPKSQGDRDFHSFRTAGDRWHTRRAVEIEEAPSMQDVLEEMLLELKAIRLGMELMIEANLREQVVDKSFGS